MENPIYSVKQLNKALRTLLEDSYGSIWVTGEISTVAAPNSGHLYFSLKEGNAVIRCAFFRNRQSKNGVRPFEGMQVLVHGQISYYEPRGDLQFIVSYLEESGEGLLWRAFEQLKLKLTDEGLFDNEYKSDLPKYPNIVGIVTSETGAALHDILVTLNRRYPLAQVIVYPAIVQGKSAPESIVKAIDLAEQHSQSDVLIIARGGGSLEDLQAFNEEIVARRIFDCNIPIVSAIGHEVDFTICDFVADRRAPTPTAAAEIVTPELSGMHQLILVLHQNLNRQIQRVIRDSRQHLDYISIRLVRPQQRLSRYQNDHKSLTKRIDFLAKNNLTSAKSNLDRQYRLMTANSPNQRIKYAAQGLNHTRSRLLGTTTIKLESMYQCIDRLQNSVAIMSPSHTLDRGYAIVQNRRQQVINDPAAVQPGEGLAVLVSKGEFNVIVGDQDAQ